MDEQTPLQQQIQINIELDDKMAEGTYANLAIINHSPAEFVIDFTRLLPGVQKAKVNARIVMTPQHAKMLLQALGENIGLYESTHGAIKIVGMQTGNQMGFHAGGGKNLS
ncbi:MAG: DUF3467 domain-containing protein [Rhizobacter sp.]|nr:DUF3467 domain-containing protein [Chlorobiales bacterium]